MLEKSHFTNAIKQNIEMVKGDTLMFNFQLVGVGNQDLRNIRFTVRDHYDNDEVLFKCDLDDHITLVDYDKETDTRTYCVRVAPTKTENISIGRYYYDLELNIEDDIYTLMRGYLDITWEVTRR